MSPPVLSWRSKIFAIATCESVKMVIIIDLLFLVFLMLSFKTSEIAHSSASNEFFFFLDNGVFHATWWVFHQTKQQLLLHPPYLALSHLFTGLFQSEFF